ncbi:unnamed protein product [Rangifer tarandus platyrhynchus]|uniref:Uncharacterized protein n=3 Tax=Rangifer tarandus platyrhynchus TaxID=3082113 RepID=A0AC59ZT85_RANTA|nr:unnamed protein product [Rangifer tarandus platyrhynchus]CAI9706064.1 unnamed protein product [Rangifer tarandus platyrhynchus]
MFSAPGALPAVSLVEEEARGPALARFACWVEAEGSEFRHERSHCNATPKHRTAKRGPHAPQTERGGEQQRSPRTARNRTRLRLFLLLWMPQIFPLLPQQSGSDPLRDSHIYPAASQCEEQGLTVFQGSVPAAPL